MKTLKPIEFPQANKTLVKPRTMFDYECGSLVVYTDGRQCISCWKMTFRQRLTALIFGRIWLSVLNGTTQPPVWVACSKTVFEKEG